MVRGFATAHHEHLKSIKLERRSDRSRRWSYIGPSCHLHDEAKYSCATEERDAFLAQALNQFAEPSNMDPITNASPGDRTRSAHDLETEGDDGEVFDLDPLIRENEEECSGGETRTHNLAVNSRLLCH
jgi:hypothetical protein